MGKGNIYISLYTKVCGHHFKSVDLAISTAPDGV